MNFSPSVYEHAAKLIGKSPWSVSRSADLLYQAHATAFKRYQHSPITVGIDIYNLEAEAYGAVVDEPDGNNIPAISTPVCSTIDELSTLANFEPGISGRLPLVLDVGKKLLKRFPHADVRIPVSGPVSIASTLMRMEGFLMELALNPDNTRNALVHIADGQVAFCQEIHRHGLDITFFESAAAPPLLSPDQFRTIVLPVLKTMMQRISEIVGHPLAFVIGGDTTPILEAILETGTKYVICPSETDQEAFMQKIWNRTDVTVRINMDPKIIAFGNWDEIRVEVDRILSLAQSRKNVCLGTGALPYETPPENVEKVRHYLAQCNSFYEL